MNKIYKFFWLLAVPLLSFMVTGCVDEEDYVDLHPRIASIAPVRGVPGTEVTIMGRNLAGISSVRIGDLELDAGNFRIAGDNSIVITIPEDAEAGSQQVRLTGSSGSSVVNFEVQGAVAMPDYVIFNDALHADWEAWGGWGGVASDMANNENPMEGAGTRNMKISWSDAWGGFQLHPTNPNPFRLADYSRVMISVMGGAGMDGKKIHLFIKTTAGTEGPKKEIVLTEDYVSYSIPLSELGNPVDINELNLQNEEGGTLIYVDAFGLD
ncbi:IPT/TIG domain-containing protein [Pontibacter sp. SGAir0037]|uniref:IPT/TIG domain-containing protein n=1 Tax=Pontibacter sp. SGAir0037 TaxID=2571030 RepID=UPI0010CD2106|nr:IPT/TIG domain-containing protein [Pontibacter sp. SGAir0037]QCR23500.1 hypothetical protein C1N53_14885 [Pontibacter sp. SGAir0037]